MLEIFRGMLESSIIFLGMPDKLGIVGEGITCKIRRPQRLPDLCL